MVSAIDRSRADEFKALRKSLGYTQKQLAEFIEVGVSTISHWEQGVWPVKVLAFNFLKLTYKSLRSQAELDDATNGSLHAVKARITALAGALISRETCSQVAAGTAVTCKNIAADL